MHILSIFRSCTNWTKILLFLPYKGNATTPVVICGSVQDQLYKNCCCHVSMNMLGSYFSPFQLTKDYKQCSEACVPVRGMVQSSAFCGNNMTVLDLRWAGSTLQLFYNKNCCIRKT